MPKRLDEAVGPEDTAPGLEDAAETTAPAVLARCNVPGCREHPETRGLCGAHWQTHRGLAGPAQKEAP